MIDFDHILFVFEQANRFLIKGLTKAKISFDVNQAGERFAVDLLQIQK